MMNSLMSEIRELKNKSFDPILEDSRSIIEVDEDSMKDDDDNSSYTDLIDSTAGNLQLYQIRTFLIL